MAQTHRVSSATLAWPQQLPALSWFPLVRLYWCENGCSWEYPRGWPLWGDFGEEKGGCCPPPLFGAAGAGAKVKARLVHPREGIHAAGPDRGGLAMGERRGHRGAQVPFPMKRLPKKHPPPFCCKPPPHSKLVLRLGLYKTHKRGSS